MIAGIVDHQKNSDAIPLNESVTDMAEKLHRAIITREWEFCVQWTDGTQSWILLKDVKNANPIMAAE